jgi:hypothetical protein
VSSFPQSTCQDGTCVECPPNTMACEGQCVPFGTCNRPNINPVRETCGAA